MIHCGHTHTKSINYFSPDSFNPKRRYASTQEGEYIMKNMIHMCLQHKFAYIHNNVFDIIEKVDYHSTVHIVWSI